MTALDPLRNNKTPVSTDALPPLPDEAADITPPIGVTPPQVLAQDAATGRRGAAWRLLYWIIENDPRAVIAVSSLEDDRLAHHLLEFIAMSTWAGKPFVVPPPLRSAHARTRLRTLFLPESGMETARAERVLRAGLSDKRPAMRETSVHILGIMRSKSAVPALIAALRDPVPTVQLQAVKALGRAGGASAVPALLQALRGADEQMGSQIFVALVQIGRVAVPPLIEASASGSAWMRWHCIRALADIDDLQALPVLVQALRDSDHSVAWMAAKGLVKHGKWTVGPVLRLLTTADATPWLVETAAYVLSSQSQRNAKLKPYLEPVLQNMRGVAYKVATPYVAMKALRELTEAGLINNKT